MRLWLEELKDDPDKEFLSDGIISGFQIVPVNAKFKPAETHNYASATEPVVRNKVEQTLLEEIAEGNYMVVNKEPTVISALKAVPKPDSDETRLVHDCSQPKGSSLNDYAEIDSFKFQSVDDAIALLREGYYMAKIDLRHAYRTVHIQPNNYQATGLKWKFQNSKKFTYMVDTRLPYGGRRALGIFHHLTQAVKHMMARHGYKAIVVYLHDFLVIGPP